jgi:hypothetical protein
MDYRIRSTDIEKGRWDEKERREEEEKIRIELNVIRMNSQYITKNRRN